MQEEFLTKTGDLVSFQRIHTHSKKNSLTFFIILIFIAIFFAVFYTKSYKQITPSLTQETLPAQKPNVNGYMSNISSLQSALAQTAVPTLNELF